MTVTYDGATYYYAVNPQGDVLAILDATGVPIAVYSYDAWGNQLSGPTSGTSSVGQLNPLRYRGYVYDQDTGFYYLQSRYYNPKVGRFLNVDDRISLDELTGANMFTYCLNGPMNRLDPSGNASTALKKDITDREVNVYGAGGGTFVVLVFAVAIAASAKDSQTKTNERVIVVADVATKPSKKNVLYYGVDMQGGTWKYVTAGMKYEEAIAWVCAMAATNTYGKRAKWGLYTKKRSDALAITIALGGAGPCLHQNRVGEYPHYHPAGMLLFGKYKHFHIWYGNIYGR